LRLPLALVVCAAVAVTLMGCEGQSVAALRVGDCFNLVSAVDANGDNTVAYDVVNCAQPHDAELFSKFNYPQASAWPGYEAIGSLQQTRCQADFKDYVGVAWDQSSYTIDHNSPTESTWASGDRQIQCVLADAGAGKLIGSARDSKK
jgi:hypothetical protein